jgi:hypothetical protein
MRIGYQGQGLTPFSLSARTKPLVTKMTIRLSRCIPLLLLAAVLPGCQQQNALVNEAKASPTVATKASADNPVVVELYQSQGCSSCPPANAALNAVADRPDIIALSFAVTYWDRLGWKDIFADKAYTQRQYDYAAAFKNPNVYTPQIVINGARAITGIKQGELARNIAASTPPAGGPEIINEGARVTIGSGTGSANIWLIRYDPRINNVAIRAGENNGRTLPHKNIVRALTKLGVWNGKAVSLPLPKAGDAQWKSVILIQKDGAGPIISAKKI